jgi:ABC-2 type transport system permease protein
MLWRITLAEISRIAARPRSYIGFIAITVIVALIHIAMLVDGESYLQFITNPMQAGFTLSGKILNGNLVCFIILQTLILQIPLLVALITGDLISGEAAMGTLRLLLTRPVSRSTILMSKFLAGAFYTLILLLWLGVIALLLGRFLFGSGDLIVLKSDAVVVLQGADTTWRFLAALGVAFLSLLVVASFSIVLSVFAENSIGPIITTMAVIILFTIIGTMEIPLFDKIKPFLFTTHMVVWRSFFDNPLDIELIRNSLITLAAHVVLFMSVALYAFRKKDILS